jgi:peptide/nickel transport system permease protein
MSRLLSAPLWAGIILATVSFLAIASPVLPLQDPYVQQSLDRLMPPSSAHWLGTDDLGRDLLSRLLHGGRYSLFVGMVAVGISLGIGGTLGICGGYAGGWIDRGISSITEILLAVPGILIALVTIAVLGPSLFNIMIAVGLSQIPHYARQSRASVLSIRSQDFVLASRMAGSSHGRIMLYHILPNVAGPILVLATMGLGSAILESAALSFLGLSGDPNRPEWGSMLHLTRERFQDQPWLVLVPGLAISGSVLSFNILGDWLRDRLDPKLQSRG